LGGLGFANWAYEVAEQERELGVFFDTIIVCSVTGSTQAGMVAGFAALEETDGQKRRVLGVDASAKPGETHAQVTRIAAATARLIGVRREVAAEDVELDDRYHAGTYGIPDEPTLDAMRVAARTEGMITDPVYEGKSMAAMIDLVSRGEIKRNSTVLYAHLGGQPAINGYSALFS
jgi:1-aminocyclopropane-1-carboxylate deaminase